MNARKKDVESTPSEQALPASAGSAFRVTKEEIYRGYIICSCGKYAHITDHRILRHLPRGYSGEMCSACHCLMLPICHLPNAERIQPTTQDNEPTTRSGGLDVASC